MQVQMSIRFCLMALAATLSLSQFSATADPVRLSDFKWQNRLLVACDMRPAQTLLMAKVEVGEIVEPVSGQDRKLILVALNKSEWTVNVPGKVGDAPKIAAWMSEYADKLQNADESDEKTQRLKADLEKRGFIPYDENRLVLLPYKHDCEDCAPVSSENHRRQIANRLRCGEGDQVTALIGLDGEIKQTWRDQVPSAETVFALIDAMPMRQQELQNAPPEKLTE